MYRFISKYYPKNIKEKYKNLISYSNLKIPPDKFLGFILIFGILFSLFFAFDLAIIFRLNFILLFIALFFVFEIIIYLWLSLQVDAKAKFVEEILPDALQLMASNLKAGLTTDKAVLLSARPEFGPFQDEINQVGKEITMGKNIEEALLDMTKRIKSDKLQKTIELLTSGMRAGGELASLLEQTADNLRSQKAVEKKIKANVSMYVIFIFSAVAFGAPLLFGLSSFLTQVLSKTISEIEILQTTFTSINLPLTITKVSISPTFITQFSILSLVTTAILASLVLGLINKGKEKEGVKYIPMLLISSLLIFFLTRYVIAIILGGLFGL